LNTKGTLYLCGTPIGNLKDITLRAIDTLKSVDLIAAEDTGTAKKLLSAYEIKKPLVSYKGFKEKAESKKIIDLLEDGKDVALISEAGMPGLSDPGYLTVLEATIRGIKIAVVPGPSAIISALVVSGLKTDSFTFEGFLPQKKGNRLTILKELSKARQTLIFYESPRRIVRTIEEITEIMGDRHSAVARELTKKFEEVIRGKLSIVKEQLIAKNQIKGEIVLLVSGAGEKEIGAGKNVADAEDKFNQLVEMNLSRRDAAKITQLFTGVNKKNFYK
jgi:16S rRNA (cytidine1402-2'-O)-methyltransferase